MLTKMAMEIEAWSEYKDEMGFAFATDLIQDTGITKKDLEEIAKLQSIGTQSDKEMIQYLEICLDEMEEDGEL
jgi:hypothetical protein